MLQNLIRSRVNVASHLLRRAASMNTSTRHLSADRFDGKFISFEIKDSIAVVRFNDLNSKVNTLSEELMKEAQEVFGNVRNDTRLQSLVKGIVFISGKPDCFIAGADIKMLERCKSVKEAQALATEGHKFLNELENSPIPIVSAIKGSCLGGGLEVALATQYRIAVNDKSTQLALPEVMLGLLPGGGGTQRLPRLIEFQEALKIVLMAKHVRPPQAKKLGLIDAMIEPIGPGVASVEERTLEYLEEVAIQTAKQLADKKIKINRTFPLKERLLRQALKVEFVREKILDKARTEVNKFAKGHYPAPLKIIDVVGSGLYKSREEGFADEIRGFAELTQTPESKALIGLFHGHTHCKKNHFGEPKQKVKTIAVLGAGLMGAGIAQVSINRPGWTTILKDTTSKGLTRGQEQIYKSIDSKLEKKRITQFDHDLQAAALEPTLTYDKFKNVDIVIEAVFEDIKIKHKVIQEVEAVTPDHCIFATNTSALPIKEIAKVSKRPDKVIGMHYFSPVDKMPLLEIVKSDQTSQDTVATAVDVGLKQKKVVIVVNDCPGFYTTRCLGPTLSEIILILQEGVTPTDIDKWTTQFGYPIGAITLMDEVGIDVATHVATYMRSVYSDRFVGGNLQLLNDMVAAGNLGRKAGKGFFLYDKKKKKDGERELNPSALEILKKYSVAPKIKPTADDIALRLAARFINEAVLCLQEGILTNPLEGDIGAIFGIGFPPFHGGPFRFLDTNGCDTAVDTLKRFQDLYGSHFAPAQMLLDYAKDKSKKFHK